MKILVRAALCGLVLVSASTYAQENEIVVTGSRISNSLSSVQPVSAFGSSYVPARPPVIGLKRQADSAVRNIEIVSDSLDAAMRKKEVQSMLLAAIDRAKASGFTLVTGQYELTEVTRANWQDQFPGLAGREDPAADEDYDYDDEEPSLAFEDDGRSATIRLKVKTKLDGSIDNAQAKISGFVKSVPVTGRSLIEQQGGLALTIVNPEQYRDEIYKRIAAGAKHAESFYGQGYGLDVIGLDQALAWSQVSNTEVFLYIPYSFAVRK